MEGEAAKIIVPLLESIPSPTVVELGAANGRDSEWLYEATRGQGFYLAVEPDPRNVELFWKRHRGRRNMVLDESAISDQDGRADLWLCDNDLNQELGSSSIRKPTRHLELFKWCRFDEIVQVPTISLDSLYRQYCLNHVDFLWVDIQGAEGDMIRGGQQALSVTDWMFLEAETEAFYDGQTLRPELLAMLPDWQLVQEFEWNLLLKRNGVQG